MSKPLRKGNRGQDFRTLPDDNSLDDNAIIDVLIRNILARQGILRSVLEDDEDTEIFGFVGSMTVADGENMVLAAIQEMLAIDHTDFYAQPNKDGPLPSFAKKQRVRE